MIQPKESQASAARDPLDTLAIMAALLMAADVRLGTDPSPPQFYASRALELYLAAQERVEPKLRAHKELTP